MSKMKDLLIDILTLHEGGYTVHEISDVCGLTPENVVEVLVEWGPEMGDA
jgi:hypothetical protein